MNTAYAHSQGAYDPEPENPKQSGISGQLNDLGKQISELGMVADDLRSRLGSVLTPDEPPAPDRDSGLKEVRARCPVADQIAGLAGDVTRITAHLTQTLQRVEV